MIRDFYVRILSIIISRFYPSFREKNVFLLLPFFLFYNSNNKNNNNNNNIFIMPKTKSLRTRFEKKKLFTQKITFSICQDTVRHYIAETALVLLHTTRIYQTLFRNPCLEAGPQTKLISQIGSGLRKIFAFRKMVDCWF